MRTDYLGGTGIRNRNDTKADGIFGNHSRVIQMVFINDQRNESGIRDGTAPNFGAKHAALRIYAISGRYSTWWIDPLAGGM